MIEVNGLDRAGKRQLLNGLMRTYKLGYYSSRDALNTAHAELPGFTAVMAKNVRLMRPESAFEKSVLAVLAGPAAPAQPKPRATFGAAGGRMRGLEKLRS